MTQTTLLNSPFRIAGPFEFKGTIVIFYVCDKHGRGIDFAIWWQGVKKSGKRLLHRCKIQSKRKVYYFIFFLFSHDSERQIIASLICKLQNHRLNSYSKYKARESEIPISILKQSVYSGLVISELIISNFDCTKR